MGRRGPQKTPADIKIARGTFRKDRDGDPSETPSPQKLNSAPTPASLGSHGAEKWKESFERLSELGVITDNDLDALEMYCRCYDEVARLDELLKTTPHCYTTEKGSINTHPYIGQRDQWLRRMKQYQDSFGLTPSTRGSVKVDKPKKPTVSRRQRA